MPKSVIRRMGLFTRERPFQKACPKTRCPGPAPSGMAASRGQPSFQRNARGPIKLRQQIFRHLIAGKNAVKMRYVAMPRRAPSSKSSSHS